MEDKQNYIKKIDNLGPISIIRIQGDFDVNSTPGMCHALEAKARELHPEAVLLDFKGVKRVDSAAFACLISLILNRIEDPARVGIFNLDSLQQSLFDILQVHKIINKFASEKEAIGFFQKKKT